MYNKSPQVKVTKIKNENKKIERILELLNPNCKERILPDPQP